jgi:hypothetical protein
MYFSDPSLFSLINLDSHGAAGGINENVTRADKRKMLFLIEINAIAVHVRSEEIESTIIFRLF